MASYCLSNPLAGSLQCKTSAAGRHTRVFIDWMNPALKEVTGHNVEIMPYDYHALSTHIHETSHWHSARAAVESMLGDGLLNRCEAKR